MTDDYKNKLEKGLNYQDFIIEQLYENGIVTISYNSRKNQIEKGENKAGFEIKFDDRYKETKNLYIEVAEKSNPKNKEFIPSGIYRPDNTRYYIIGDYSRFFMFNKKQLRIMYETEHYKKIGGRFIEIPTSQGFVIPVSYVEKWLGEVYEINNK